MFKNSHGGEIFIPKMNSIKITDLIKLLDKNAKIKVVGIRPGEKIHESLFSLDEARSVNQFKTFLLSIVIIYIIKKNMVKKLKKKKLTFPQIRNF